MPCLCQGGRRFLRLMREASPVANPFPVPPLMHTLPRPMRRHCQPLDPFQDRYEQPPGTATSADKRQAINEAPRGHGHRDRRSYSPMAVGHAGNGWTGLPPILNCLSGPRTIDLNGGVPRAKAAPEQGFDCGPPEGASKLAADRVGTHAGKPPRKSRASCMPWPEGPNLDAFTRVLTCVKNGDGDDGIVEIGKMFWRAKWAGGGREVQGARTIIQGTRMARAGRVCAPVAWLRWTPDCLECSGGSRYTLTSVLMNVAES